MRILIVCILFFPVVVMGQQRFDVIREKLMQDKTYEYVYGFENNYAVFRTFDNTMGLMDTTGSVIIQPKYTYLNNRKELKNLLEVGSEINKVYKRGFIDLKENIKVPIIYDQVYYVGNGLIRVVINNKYGVIDTLDNNILPIEYDLVAFDNNLIVGWKGKAKYLYDEKGAWLNNLQCTDISRFIDNRAIIAFEDTSNAVIDNHGNIVLKPAEGYRFESVLNEKLYIVKNQLTSKVGLLNGEGVLLIGCKYDEIKQEKTCFLAKDNTKWGFISKNDSILKPFVYDMVYSSLFGGSVEGEEIKKGESYRVKRGNLYGVINPNMENEVIPIQYKSITTLFDRYYIVMDTENRNGLYLANGDKILNEEYVFYNVYERNIFASKNDKQYLIHLENEKFREIEVVADEYLKIEDDFEYPQKANQIFILHGKYGVVNYENSILIPNEYELIENNYLGNEFIVKKNGKFGLINAENKIVVEIEYDEYKQGPEVIRFTKANKTINKYYEITLGTEEPPRTD